MDKEEQLNMLAAEFFREFARFEYALKATGFHKGEGLAKADWREFALSVEEHFKTPKSDELSVAVEFLEEEPPMKQVIKSGKLEWESSKPSTDSRVDRLLIYVRRVRNNLFHGGKFNGHWFAPESAFLPLTSDFWIPTSDL